MIFEKQYSGEKNKKKKWKQYSNQTIVIFKK